MQLLNLSLLASAAAGALAAEELKIDVTHPVQCARKTQQGDKISVHYRGTLQSNGEKFDASYDRNQPLDFTVGNGQVIKGWDQGLLDMCIGEKRTLTVPPSHGYGQRAMGPIPAGSTLVFETELMGIDGVPQPDVVDEAKEAKPTGTAVTSRMVHPATAAPDADTQEDTGAEEKADAQKDADAAKDAETPDLKASVASVVGDAAQVVKTLVADNGEDAVQGHEEL